MGTEQDTLFQRSQSPIFVYYREIQSDDLNKRHITNNKQVENFNEVLDGFERQTGAHSFDELELDPNPQILLKSIMQNYPDHDDQQCALLVNDFCSSMRTSARQEGKYAVLIVTKESLFICHTDSKEKSITKNVDVIERLLDTDNVNKYAEFRDKGDEIIVRHYERNPTESLSGWLGIEPHEISYRDAGEVQIFTEIDDSTCAFQYGRDEFEKKFILDEEGYELIENVLRTPVGNEYPVQQVKFGRRTYQETSEFLQDFYSIYYEVQSFREHFNRIASTLEPYQANLFDHENKVTEGKNGRKLVVKHHDAFEVVFASNGISVSESWLVNLTNRFKDGETTPIFHAGRPFSREPIQLGSYRIHNRTEVSSFERLNQLYRTMQKAGTSEQLSNLLSYVMFTVASDWIESPLSYFFEELADKYSRMLDANGVVLQDEDELVEFKDRDWFVAENDEELVRKITEEIQADTRLLIGGIDEENQQFTPLNRGRFDSERNRLITNKLQQTNGNHDSVNLQSIQLENGECILFVFSVRGDPDLSGLEAI